MPGWNCPISQPARPEVPKVSASLILACLAEGMSAEEIEESYGPFPREAIPEVLKAASELLDSPHVAA
jgi:uncharacterized protein (DUF433 family)